MTDITIEQLIAIVQQSAVEVNVPNGFHTTAIQYDTFLAGLQALIAPAPTPSPPPPPPPG